MLRTELLKQTDYNSVGCRWCHKNCTLYIESLNPPQIKQWIIFLNVNRIRENSLTVPSHFLLLRFLWKPGLQWQIAFVFVWLHTASSPHGFILFPHMSPFEAGIKERESFEVIYFILATHCPSAWWDFCCCCVCVCFDAWSLATNKISIRKKLIWKISLNDFHMTIPDAQHVSM